jgi:hypothetical protein
VRALEARGWDTAIRSVLATAVPGSRPDEWELASASNPPNLRRCRRRAAARRALLQGAPAGPDGGSGPLRTAWRRLSRTPSLDAFRLWQPGPPTSLCTTQLCAALLAAGVDLDPAFPITVTPVRHPRDPGADLTARRAAAQASAAARRPRRAAAAIRPSATSSAAWSAASSGSSRG